ncbi:hypothetical protein BC941DRAFT_467715 [Chlamydoabsidia padenii]|nr:hypothetical protein BC941DRAFT_467715 [Chlamydoabsidia padenii]
MKESLYECWMCFYGPVFWIMYMFACTYELHKTQQQSLVDDMTFTTSENDVHDGRSLNTNPSSRQSIFNSAINAKTHLPNDDLRSIRSSKSFRRTLKIHLRTIRQKQQSLNDVMRRSLLRRASKISLVPLYDSDRRSIAGIKPSTSLPTPNLSDSPPPPTSASSPFLLSSSSPTVHRSQYGNKMKYMYPLTLDRRVSLSDSLLKSISMKRKRTPLPNSGVNSKHYKNNDIPMDDVHKEVDSLSLSRLSSLSTSPLPKPSCRRKTAPEIFRNNA